MKPKAGARAQYTIGEIRGDQQSKPTKRWERGAVKNKPHPTTTQDYGGIRKGEEAVKGGVAAEGKDNTVHGEKKFAACANKTVHPIYCGHQETSLMMGGNPERRYMDMDTGGDIP